MTERENHYPRSMMLERSNALYATLKDRVRAGNKGKVLAVDLVTGEYEIDEEQWTAIDRLNDRLGNPQIVCFRIGYKAVHSLAGGVPEEPE